LHGLSDNRFKGLDISDARELIGYAPQDDTTEEHSKLRVLHLWDHVHSHSAVADGEPSCLQADAA